METIGRGGDHYRVADPGWSEPLDGSHSVRHGGRWNAPGSLPVTYLNADVGTARANARRLLTVRLAGQPVRADDLEPSELPILVTAEVPALQYVDAVTPVGCAANRLPPTYPADELGRTVSWETCRPVGRRAWDGGQHGVACRSAALHAPTDGEELAWFDRHDPELTPRDFQPFEIWYGPFDW